MTAGADGSTMVPVMQISPEGPAMIVTSQPAAVRAAAPDAHAPLRLPGRLRAARRLALALGTINALGAVAIGITESDQLHEWALGAVILVLALAWWPVALRLAPARPEPARAALVLAVLGIVHAVFDVVVAGWYSSAVFGVVCVAIAALVAPFARR
jgi:hypothetical protein